MLGGLVDEGLLATGLADNGFVAGGLPNKFVVGEEFAPNGFDGLAPITG